MEVTTSDILNRVGLKSISAFRKWLDAGLIPRPTLRKHPRGKGRIAIWPASVVDRCIEIRRLTRKKISLEEIFEKLGAWTPPSKPRKPRKSSLPGLEREAMLFRLRELANKALRRFARECVNFPDQEIFSLAQLKIAKRQMQRGQQPLLLVTQKGMDVVSATKFSEWLTTSPLSNLVTAVIPVQGLLDDDAAKELDESHVSLWPQERELRVIQLD